MVTILRGDPSRYSVEQMRAAFDAGARASARFVALLRDDARAGARAVARCFERRERDAQHAEVMLELERALWATGVRRIAGVDEAGMGPLAGPVVAAAVVLACEGVIPCAEDSKALDASEREALCVEIRRCAVAVGVGIATVGDIAESDIYRAGLLAMRRAVEALPVEPEALLVDARTVPGVSCPQQAHVKGDARSRSIAAASIVAKVERDRLMTELAQRHPGYGFEHHFGYSTPEHLEALRRLGPCEAHRTSWAALAEHSGAMSGAFYALKESLRDACDPQRMASWKQMAQDLAAELTSQEARRLDMLARRRMHAFAGDGDASGQMHIGA